VGWIALSGSGTELDCLKCERNWAGCIKCDRNWAGLI
jgi:hypothetical protein